MCCFSGPVQAVANTRIFARLSGVGTQFLAYQMDYAASRDLAMILPLPIQMPARETSVRFISLQKYPAFFDDMESPGYYEHGAVTGGVGGPASVEPPLVVHSVGGFSASFVPTVRDFERLDKQFVLPPQVWDKIPAYRDFGFAVFKLKAVPAGRVQGQPHPMAFEFRTRFNDRLFLPTLHIHDGEVHPTETFDHALYMQDARLTARDERNARGGVHPTRPNDLLSNVHAAHFMKVPATQKIVAAHLSVFKRPLTGTHANRDVYVPLT